MAIVDETRFEQLYASYAELVRATIFKLCGASELDDLVQEAFVKIWGGLHNFRGDAQLKTWIYRVAYNVAVDYLRQPARRMMATSQEQSVLSRQHSESHEKRLLYRDLVQKGLQSLSIEHRGVLVLHTLQGLTIADIAAALEIPLGTVKSRLFTARQQMWEFLKQNGIDL